MQHKNQFRCHIRHPNLLHYYLDAGLAAGAAAFSSLAGVLFAGFASFLTSSTFLTSAFAGAAGAAGAFAGSAAIATDANATAAINVAIDFILKFPLG
jgi:hypothetical protein